MRWPRWLRGPDAVPFGYELKGTAICDRLEVPLPHAPWPRHYVFHLDLGQERKLFHLPDPHGTHRIRPGHRYRLLIHANLNWAWFRDQALRLSEQMPADRTAPSPDDFPSRVACRASPPQEVEVTLKTGDQLFSDDAVEAGLRYTHRMTFCRAGVHYSFASLLQPWPLDQHGLYTAALKQDRSAVWFQGHARPVQHWRSDDDDG